MARHIFECIDAHTCGNPVRLVKKGGPKLEGITMAEKRQHFLKEFDWVRTGLMFEPRGHDMMSGSILYDPVSDDFDVGVLFIETSGCLPMCGHGTIGTVTIMIQEGLIQSKTPDMVVLETPAGRVEAHYTMEEGKVKSVRIINVASFLHSENLEVYSSVLGDLTVDISYGGNFYAIVDLQENFQGLENFTAGELINMSSEIRTRLNDRYEFIHPEDDRIRGCSHILWTGKTLSQTATARNAVFYGDKAIDRSPCGTGTSSRMAQWAAKGKLNVGDSFIHESIIGSQFVGKVEAKTKVGNYDAIIPSIEGWARITGYSTILIDENDDPFAHGFQVL